MQYVFTVLRSSRLNPISQIIKHEESTETTITNINLTICEPIKYNSINAGRIGDIQDTAIIGKITFTIYL